MDRWDTRNITDQHNKIFIITGANSGLGLASARVLAKKGAKVIMACRNLEKGSQSLQKIRDEFPGADLDLRELDLADLRSVADFASGILKDYDTLDVLINNAGIMATPFAVTADGFERQFGTNHLGHFALTGKLLQRLLKTRKSRVVNVSSLAARSGKIFFDDLEGKEHYSAMERYRQSKLANLLFTFELKRKLEQHDIPLQVIAAHPGVSATNLHRAMNLPTAIISIYDIFLEWLLPDADKGSLSILFAATDPAARSGASSLRAGWFFCCNLVIGIV